MSVTSGDAGSGANESHNAGNESLHTMAERFLGPITEFLGL